VADCPQYCRTSRWTYYLASRDIECTGPLSSDYGRSFGLLFPLPFRAHVANLNQGLGASGSGAKSRIRTISPVSYVASHDPPFLIIHGTDDWFIAPHHSQNFARLLHAAGVPVTLIMVQYDGHGLATPILQALFYLLACHS